MKNSYKLTIGIPTFNGESTICDTMDSIISQFNLDTSDKVEILISNNKSTDNTEKIINNYISKYPQNIKILTNERDDLKLDGNMLNIFNNAKGEFVWIMSDDDAFEKGSLVYVLNIIEQYNDVGVIFTNYSENNADLKYNTKRFRDEITENHLCVNGDEFFKKSKLLFGLISALIFKRNSWINSDLDQYIGLNSLHIGALIQILNKENSFIIADKLVKFRMGTETWGENGTFIIIGYQFTQMFHSMKYLNYKKETIDYIFDTFYPSNHVNIAIAKAKGLVNTKEAYIEMKKCYGHKLLFWILDIPLLLLPNILYKIAYKAYKVIKK